MACPTTSAERQQSLLQQNWSRPTNRQPSARPPYNPRQGPNGAANHAHHQQVQNQPTPPRQTPPTQPARQAQQPVHANGHYQPPRHLASPAQVQPAQPQTSVFLPQVYLAVACSSTPMVRYEQGVLLDSGASLHMTGNFDLLCNPVPHLTDVIIADGSISQSTHIGSVHVQVFCKYHQKEFTIELQNCLCVPGFKNTL